jgi:hypothetical protein
MLIKIFNKEVLRRKNQKSVPMPKIHRVGLFKCDQCKSEYEIDGRLNYVLSKEHHFCSRVCQGKARKVGGCLHYVYDLFDSSFSDPMTKEKIKQVKYDKYGPLGSDARKEIAVKTKETMLKRYGGKSSFSAPLLRHKFDFAKMAKKRHETMKASGVYKTSKEEDTFFEFLKRFGHIERNVVVKNVWPIDFYILDNDVYVQFDGVYWHGLDRSIEEISTHKTARDVVIHKKWQTDREQEKWFKENGMRLIRIPSSEFNRKELTCPLFETALSIFSTSPQHQ